MKHETFTGLKCNIDIFILCSAISLETSWKALSQSCAFVYLCIWTEAQIIFCRWGCDISNITFCLCSDSSVLCSNEEHKTDEFETLWCFWSCNCRGTCTRSERSESFLCHCSVLHNVMYCNMTTGCFLTSAYYSPMLNTPLFHSLCVALLWSGFSWFWHKQWCNTLFRRMGDSDTHDSKCVSGHVVEPLQQMWRYVCNVLLVQHDKDKAAGRRLKSNFTLSAVV